MVTMCDVSKLYQNLADVSLRLDYGLLILSSLNTNWAKYEIEKFVKIIVGVGGITRQYSMLHQRH